MTRADDSPAADGSPLGSDRGNVIGTGLLWLAKWSLCLVAIAAGLWVTSFAIAELWVAVLPVLLAIVIATVLWPPTRAMTKIGIPPALAAAVTLLGFAGVVGGIVALIVPSIIDQSPKLAEQATAGVLEVRDWLRGPPLEIRDEQLNSAVEAIVSRVQSSADQIAAGVFTGVSAATSAIITFVLVLFLTFFFVKDGPRFMPWLHSVTGRRSGQHLEAVLTRMWDTLGGFIRTQALVSLIDAVFIGAGLLILGVPLALVLTVITFIGGFIPMVGAVVAGALAVLVALVAKGLSTALIVLALILVVQQIEGNVLQPILQSRSMNLHPVVVLLAVTAGGSLYGIVGAFLAVPAAAIGAVLLRYLGEQIDARDALTQKPEAPAENPTDPG